MAPSGGITEALEEDALYAERMAATGVEAPPNPYHSLQRELTIMAGEEAGSEAAGASCAAAGALACNIPCAIGGGLVRGVAGDYAGGWKAAKEFDEANQALTDEEVSDMLGQAASSRTRERNNSDEEGPKLTTEPSGVTTVAPR